MSAFGTKKPLSDVELQLSFPTNFQQAYAMLDLPLAYEGASIRPSAGLPYAKDLQGDWHEQKRLDAHRRVMNAVRDTRAATHRSLVSHAGYWGMPRAVLSQRVFANPSLGSGGLGGDIYSARRTAPDSDAPFACTANGMRGGVLRSKEGQAFGKRILMNRIDQLNKIDAEQAGLESGIDIDKYADPSFQISQGLPEQAGIGSQVQLVALLQGLVSALSTSGGINRFTFADLPDLALLLFRVAPISNKDELSNIKASFDELLEIVDGYKDILRDDPEEFGVDQRLARAMVSLIPRLAQYVDRMIDALNLSPKERLAASRAAVASLGLNRYITGLREEEGRPAAARRPAAAAAQGADMDDQFDRPARPREEAAAEAAAQGAPQAGVVAVAPQAAAAQAVPLAAFRVMKNEEQRKILKDLKIRGYSKADKPRMIELYEGYMARQQVVPGGAAGLQARGKAPKAPRAAKAPQFSEDQRQVFGGPEFNYPYVDQLPPSAPVRPGLNIPRNPMRAPAPVEATLEPLAAKTREAAAPAGMRPAAEAPAPEKPVVAAGKSKRWIQEAVSHMKKGAFTKQALREGKTPSEYAEEVLSHPGKHTKTTKKRAQFLENIKQRKHPKLRNMKGGRHKGKYHMHEGKYYTGAAHTRHSQPLNVVE